MKLYREVKASERLPKSNGEYVVHLKANLGFDLMNYWASYDAESSPVEDYYNDEQLKDDWINTVEFWLEPIDTTDIEEAYYKHGLSVPNHEERAFTLAEFKEAVLSAKGITEEEIEEILRGTIYFQQGKIHYESAAKAILSKLKGDE